MAVEKEKARQRRGGEGRASTPEAALEPANQPSNNGPTAAATHKTHESLVDQIKGHKAVKVAGKMVRCSLWFGTFCKYFLPVVVAWMAFIVSTDYMPPTWVAMRMYWVAHSISPADPPVAQFIRPREPPTILNVPWYEDLEFTIFRNPVYLKQYAKGIKSAMHWAYNNHYVLPISDELVTETFSLRMYSTTLDPYEVPAVGEVFNFYGENVTVEAGTAYWISNATVYDTVKAWDGMYTAGTMALFKQPLHLGDHLICIVIAFKDVAITPNDEAWEFAKMWLMKNTNYQVTLGRHALTHFPYDTVNAHTKAVLPVTHWMYQLLFPHFRLSLSLNGAVLNAYFSAIANAFMDSNPLDISYDNIHKLLAYQFTGYEFPRKGENVWRKNTLRYGRFLTAYWDVIDNFMQEVVEIAFTPNDPFVMKWADGIRKQYRNFPSGAEVANNKKLLAETLTQVVHDLSVQHDADHWSYFYDHPTIHAPFRIRVPPPTMKNMSCDFAAIQDRYDMYKHELCRHMFYYTGPTSLTMDKVEYDFSWGDRAIEPRLNDAQNRFRQSLIALDRDLEARDERICPLNMIGCSLDI